MEEWRGGREGKGGEGEKGRGGREIKGEAVEGTCIGKGEKREEEFEVEN